MKHLAPHDRPREKLTRLGAAALGDNELLAIVIGSGARGQDALETANAVLARAAGLHGIPRIGVDDLETVTGIGRARAAQILAAVELGRRTVLRSAPARVQFKTPRDVGEYLVPQFGARPIEHFGALLLDRKNRLLKVAMLTAGTLDAAVIQPRDVFRDAMLVSAPALVLFHNHPSGDPCPSEDDLQLTRRLIAAGELMGVDVLDHIIVADGRYCSLRETGKL